MSFTMPAQSSYSGNGNSGFGGTVGGSTLGISDDGTTITFTFSRGASDLNNPVVIYVDSQSGGFSNTTGFTDSGDGLRRAISANGNGVPTITFPASFTADYAIAFDAGFGAWFTLASGASHNYGSDGTNGNANLTPLNDATSSTHTLTVDFSELGITSSDNFKFVVTHISDTAYLSNEVIGDTSSIVADGGGTNPGFDGSIAFSNSRIYPDPALSINEENLDKISIYNSGNNKLRIVGVQNENVRIKIYNILGKEVLNTSFQGDGVNNITLPYVRTGIYIIQLETKNNKLSKKLIIK